MLELSETYQQGIVLEKCLITRIQEQSYSCNLTLQTRFVYICEDLLKGLNVSIERPDWFNSSWFDELCMSLVESNEFSQLIPGS